MVYKHKLQVRFYSIESNVSLSRFRKELVVSGDNEIVNYLAKKS